MTLNDTIPTPNGDIIVMTKTRFLCFFNRPHTSVMPFGLSEFGRRLGFQVVYNTSDPDILAELHEFLRAVRCGWRLRGTYDWSKNGLRRFSR
jgi:hypothetical protein